MWELLAQASPVSPQDLGGWFGAWAATIIALSSWVGWLIRDRERERREHTDAVERAEAERQRLVERLLSLSEKVEPLAASLVRLLERER